MLVKAGRVRVVIQNVEPEIDCGRFPIKRTVGEKVVVEADVFGDGHDKVACRLCYAKEDSGLAESQGGARSAECAAPDAPRSALRAPLVSASPAQRTWNGHAPMQFLVNDRWRGEFTVKELGVYRYIVQGWIDHFQTWRGDLLKRLQAGQDVSTEMLIGGQYVEEAAGRGGGTDAGRLRDWANILLGKTALETKIQLAQSHDLSELMDQYPDLRFAAFYERELRVIVDPPRAGFSAWYELFPRSWAAEAGKHGTLGDLEAVLPYVAGMGFDVLYLPPIHPIGKTFRKGKNNSTSPVPDDPGSPWAIGSPEGGHKSVNPQLGTLEDFRRFVGAARASKLDVALDIAFQCSPDHPYVKGHPEWFRHRPDGTIQYAENPPKKYQDIYPLYFESDGWSELWDELLSVFLFWIEQGVRIFRVDNPHTKPFAFWEWLIAEVKAKHPETMFLAEAFTRPKIMYRLAKLGFTQSYTYFTWRNNKEELSEYFTELTQTEVKEYFRPNLWPNTPDILHEFLQSGGRPAFVIRFVLAATLGTNYGIYGPAFELGVNQPLRPGSEEYLNSEKYEIKDWDLDNPESLRSLITRINQVRRAHAALQSNRNLHFHPVDNPDLLCFSKTTDDLSDVILVVVNLSPHYTQSGWLALPLQEFQLDPYAAFDVHDLLTDAHYTWHGARNYVELHPDVMPAHVLHVRRS